MFILCLCLFCVLFIFSKLIIAHSVLQFGNPLIIQIPLTDNVKDLGITLTSDLKFFCHISKIYSKSISIVHIILKSFKTPNPTFYTNLYKLYVRPITEYNSTTWSPFLISDVEKIESIQRTFTRKLLQKLNISYIDYQDRLLILNLETLEIRRVKLDLIFVYKILNNLVDLNSCDFFQINQIVSTYSLRRHRFYLQKPCMPTSAVVSNFFTHRVLKTWNKLPENTVMSKTLSIFKSRLNNVNITDYYEPKFQIK